MANICLQVDAFLEAHDSGLSEADKQVASGAISPALCLASN